MASKIEEQVTEKSGTRYYNKDGRRYPSVTTIIGAVIRKPFLEKWRGDVGNRQADKRRDEAGEHGTAVHSTCGLIMRGVDAIPLDDPLLEAQVDAFKTWHDLAILEVLTVEETIYNQAHGYAGTLDERAILKGDRLPSIIDVKTGHFDEDGCRMQTAAYRTGNGIEAHRRLIVDLKNLKNGLPTIHEFKDHGSDLGAFLNTLFIYNWQRGARY